MDDVITIEYNMIWMKHNAGILTIELLNQIDLAKYHKIRHGS